MVSPELLRRYPFFAQLSLEQLATLARLGDQITTAAGGTFFEEGNELNRFYLVVEGEVGVNVQVPDQSLKPGVASQLTGDMATREITVSTVVAGEVFGWSGLVGPHQATAGARALTDCTVVAFNCPALLKVFEEDCAFGYVMIQKIARVIRERLRDLRIETLAQKS